MSADERDEKPRSAWAEAIRISDLGVRLVGSVAVLTGLGVWLDRWLAWTTFPVFAIAGAFLGFAGGMVALVRGLTRPGANGSAGAGESVGKTPHDPGSAQRKDRRE